MTAQEEDKCLIPTANGQDIDDINKSVVQTDFYRSKWK